MHEHHRGVGHVDAHLDHRGGDKHVHLPGTKVLHDRVLLGSGHATGEQRTGKVREDPLRELGQGRSGRANVGAPAALGLWDVVEVRPQAVSGVSIVHQGTDHVCLMSCRHGASDGAVGKVEVLGRDDARGDASRGPGAPADARERHVAVDGERKRARYGRCRHGEKVRPRSLSAQRRALVHAKAVLLVNDHKRETSERDVIGEERRGAKGHAEVACGRVPGRLRALGGGRRPRDKCPVMPAASSTGPGVAPVTSAQ